ncbi:MAG TPA: VOC family protein [Chitinophagaceae bacterium]
MDTGKAVSIEPWLTLAKGEQAVTFYKSAFNAVETYRLENPDGGFVVKLSINGADFWISSEAHEARANSPLGGDSLRLILVVDDPDTLFAQALKAGATEVFPVGEGHGWRLGRLSDPFGLHWEIGHQLS